MDGANDTMRKLMLLAIILFCITSSYALTAQQVSTIGDKLYSYCWESHTPYCNSCTLDMYCNVTSFTKDYLYTIKTTDFTTRAENFITKTPYTIAKSSLDIKQNTTLDKNNLLHLSATWQRDRPDVVDYIPCITLLNQTICFTKWATWSPTSFAIVTPTAASAVSNTIWVNVTFLDSNKGELFWWNENATRNTTATVMYGDNYFSMDNVSVGYFDECTAWETDRWLSPSDWTYYYGVAKGRDNWTDPYYKTLFVMSTYAYAYNHSQWYCDGSSGANCSMKMSLNNVPNLGVPRFVSVGGAYWVDGSPSYSECNFSFDNITWKSSSDDMGCDASGWDWCNISSALGATTGNVLYVKSIYPFGCMLGGISFSTTNLKFMARWNTSLLADGNYNLWFNGTNSSYYESLLSVPVTILNNIPAYPTCDAATITANHWFYNMTKHLNADPVLTMSGCIKESIWDNLTAFNASWAATSDGWLNQTSQTVLPFYGTHNLYFYCNDSINQWVKCNVDSFSITSGGGGGLTTEQNATLYSIGKNDVVDFSLQQLTILFLFLSILAFFVVGNKDQRIAVNVAIIFFSLVLAFSPPPMVMSSETEMWYYPNALPNQIGAMLFPVFALILIVQVYSQIPIWFEKL